MSSKWRWAVYAFLISTVFLVGEATIAKGLPKTFNAVLNATANSLGTDFSSGVLTASILHTSAGATAVIVKMANEGGQAHIPFVVGASVGTTVSALLFALMFWRVREEFRGAVSAALQHVLFNAAPALLFLILDGRDLLRWLSLSIGAPIIEMAGSWTIPGSPLQAIRRGLAERMVEGIKTAMKGESWAEGISVLAGVGLILFAIATGCFTIYAISQSPKRAELEKMIPDSEGWHFIAALIATVLLQSSSMLTSGLVALAASGLIKRPRSILYWVCAANIGTTFNGMAFALDAAQAAPFNGQMDLAGVQVAVSHLMFRGLTALVLLTWPKASNMFCRAVDFGVDWFTENRTPLRGFAFIALVFCVAPTAVIVAFK